MAGGEVDTIRGEMFSNGYGFVVDYIAEVLKSMRNADISMPDRDGILKTFSGLMKILTRMGKRPRRRSKRS